MKRIKVEKAMDEKKQIESYCTVQTGGSDEYVEKKSRFIATVCPVADEKEALAFIEEIKKKHWDARHNCYAYIIGRNAEIMRYSDDGEPGGTAGKPMLEVLMGAELRDTAVVVTRYFGGTLLGTGGLVRAYTKAVQLGLEASEVVTMRYGTRQRILTDYNSAGKVQYILGQAGITDYQTTYMEQVEFNILTAADRFETIRKKIVEVTAAKAEMEEVEKCYFIDKSESV